VSLPRSRADPLAVLATRLPWSAIEAHLAPKFERRDRPGELFEGQDMLGPTTMLASRMSAGFGIGEGNRARGGRAILLAGNTAGGFQLRSNPPTSVAASPRLRLQLTAASRTTAS